MDVSFRKAICELIARVPEGRVVTYSDLASHAGHPMAARTVGAIAHYGPVELPWHRLVNRFGGLAAGFPGGPKVQRRLLEAEGVSCTNFIVNNFVDRRWLPNLSSNCP